MKSFGNCSNVGFDLRNSWKQSHEYDDKIWEKWIKTILPELPSQPILIDDIVLIVDDGACWNSYRRARVIGLNHETMIRWETFLSKQLMACIWEQNN